MKCYVNVRLADTERTREWREVEAETLDAAIKVAEQMEDVEVCIEASVTPGGALTDRFTGNLQATGGFEAKGEVT